MSTEVPLTVAIDGRCLAGEPTGVGRYLVCVLREMLALDPAIRFRLLLDRAVPGPFAGEPRVAVRASPTTAVSAASTSQLSMAEVNAAWAFDPLGIFDSSTGFIRQPADSFALTS